MVMRASSIFGAILVVSLAVWGCGDEQDVDSGSSPTGSAGSAGAAGSAGSAGAAGSAGSAGTAGSAGEGPTEGTLEPTGITVQVSHGDDVASVDLGTLATINVKGEKLVPLTSVWEASGLSADLAKLTFDFEADDGFRPQSKEKCQGLFITGEMLSQGYVDPTLRNLFWDDALGLPGCYRIKGIAKVFAVDVP